jgi:DNA-binding transcriptional ArsR family regulator
MAMRGAQVASAPDLDERALLAQACLFRGLGDRSRLLIVGHLLVGEHRVVDLTSHLGLAQSTVSKHLACLQDCGLVSSHPRGRASVFSLTRPDEVRAVLASAEQLLAAVGDAVVLCSRYGRNAVEGGPR